MSNAFHGLVLRGGNSTVRGLALGQFDRAIDVQSSSNRIVGNHIGTDPTGTHGTTNIFGVYVGSFCCNVIGGRDPADRNVISGNRRNPIRITEEDAPPARDTYVIGNYLGVDATGLKPMANGIASSSMLTIRSATNTVIGGLDPGSGNVIATTWISAISIHAGATNTFVLGNYIGVAADGRTPTGTGSRGVEHRRPNSINAQRFYTNATLIKGNVIAYQNVAIGVGGIMFVTTNFPSTFFSLGFKGVTISQNSIFSNLSTAWTSNLGLTNDVGDLDEGANELQNFPVLTAARFGSNLVVRGRLNSRPDRSYTVELFGNRAPHPSGFGEGEVFLGSLEVQTDASGNSEFEFIAPVAFPEHRWIASTATDPEGNTSVFSPAIHGGSDTQPFFHVHPRSQASLPDTNVTLSAVVSGQLPLSYQWRWNGAALPGATNSTLTLSNVQWEHRGTYTLVASNAFGAVESDAAELTVLIAPVFLASPTNVAVLLGRQATFAVVVGGVPPFHYQWRWNGVDLRGENGSTFTRPVVELSHGGLYTVVVSNAFGVVESPPAELIVRVKPGFVQHPVSQSVPAGGSVVLSAAVSNIAALPLTYRWRRDGQYFLETTTSNYISFVRLTNLQTTANYAVVVSNSFGPPGTLSATATITVLPDTDGDRIPDDYESAHGLDPANPADAALDGDGDGVSNLGEYESGTDPTDAASQLRVERILGEDAMVRLEFTATSNRTYSVQFRDTSTASPWATLTNFPASPTNRSIVLRDTTTSAWRHYRLVTPQQP
ncbi:MAG TPA: immunoglobulin domain-containing protein [Methylomirabilota bacterium]|nr:immunoglobulin domain-containing protein [Methylomirabilota bacterium]